MQFGLSASNRERTHIDDVIDMEVYVCPYCESELLKRRGNINIHHFAHRTRVDCENNGKTEWHYNWQNEFENENQEVIINNEHETIRNHIADVCLKNVVVEFQKKCNNADLYLRTEYYKDLGYKPIWVIDATKAYEEGRLFFKRDNPKISSQEIYQWNHSSRSLGVFVEDIMHDFNNRIDIWLDLGEDDGLIKVCWAPLIEHEERRNMKHISAIPLTRNQFIDYVRRQINNDFEENSLTEANIERLEEIQEWGE